MNRSSILIISDDPEFARTIASHWQTARHVPEITLATSDVGGPAAAGGYGLVIVGPVRNGRLREILAELERTSSSATIVVVEEEKTYALLGGEHPHVVFVARQSAWMAGLIVLSGEAIRRVDAVRRAQRAEKLALENHNYAMLGRYMLEMRSSVNNALTSVLGNADLLMLERAQMEGDSREQVQAIHAQALRLHEIMQRFSSLASEIRLSEKESQAETEGAREPLVAGVRMGGRRA